MRLYSTQRPGVYMKVRTHLWTSIAAGSGLWWATGSSTALVGAIMGGVLIDADHVVDQIWSIRRGAPYTKAARAQLAGQSAGSTAASPRTLKDWFRRRRLIRLPLIFHSYELLAAGVLLGALVRTPLIVGLVMGYALHIALDLIRHHHEFRSPLFYLLLYRLRMGFRRDRLIKPEYL
jgi:hypothetical protein